MTTYQDVHLGEPGARFIEGCLSKGNSLARMIANRLRPDADHCMSRLPSGTASIAVSKLTEGGIGDSDQSRRWVAGVIRSYLERGSDYLAILEDPVGRRGDSFISRRQVPCRYFADEVYRVLTGADSCESIRTALDETESSHRLVCIIARGGGSAATSAPEIGEKEMRTWVNSAEAVAVLAFDGEGYVVCTALMERRQAGEAPG